MTFKECMDVYGWVTRFDTTTYTYHIMPLNDDKEHEHSSSCWCNPDLNEFNSWVHNCQDGREEYEAGRPLH